MVRKQRGEMNSFHVQNHNAVPGTVSAPSVHEFKSCLVSVWMPLRAPKRPLEALRAIPNHKPGPGSIGLLSGQRGLV